MKRGAKILLILVSGLTVWTAATAVTSAPSASPYDGIVDRNVFGLKPPPPPPDPEASKPPPGKITLTGITTILGNKRALMKTPAAAAKPGEPSKGEQSYILTVGQREGEIEVLDIDEKAGSVKVNNSGAILTLTFEKDGAKLPATPMPAAPPVPGMPLPTGGVPLPATAASPTAPHGGGFSLPTRTLRTVPNAGNVNPSAAANYRGVPTLPTYSTAQSQAQIAAQQAAAQQPTMSPEQQIIMMEAQREMNKANPKFPPLPPTQLTPPGSLPPPLPQ